MKKRMLALALLLVIALTACTQALPTTDTEAVTEAPVPSKPTIATELTEAPTETTEELTEAPTEATEAPTDMPDVDLGTVDGSAYENETLGLSASFPEGWYIYNETDILALNNLISDVYDSTAMANAIKNGQTVIFFCASHPVTMSSVNISATKSTLTGVSEATLINLSAAAVKSQLEQTGMMQDIVCKPAEAEFCGQTHTVLSVTCTTGGIQLYETIVCLTVGDYLYTLTVSATQESTAAEILHLFEAIK